MDADLERSIFQKAVDHFNREEYFDAHEHWEELWNEADGARRNYLQALIQVAVALHHATQENWNGTRKLAASSLSYLEKGRGGGDEVDLDQLKDRVLDFELALQKKLAGEEISLPFFQLPSR